MKTIKVFEGFDETFSKNRKHFIKAFKK